MPRMAAASSVHHSYQAPLQCGMCEDYNDVAWYCLDCKGNLCATCKANHPTQLPIFRSHRTVSVIEGLKRRSVEEECGTHPSYILSLYCNNCSRPLCSKCVSSREHTGHDLDDINDVMVKVQTEIQEYYDTLKTKCIPQYKAQEAKIQENFTESEKWLTSLEARIDKQRGELKSEIDRLFDDQLKKAKEEKERQTADMKGEGQRLQKIWQDMLTLTTKCEGALTKSSVEQIKFNHEKPSIHDFNVQEVPGINVPFYPTLTIKVEETGAKGPSKDTQTVVEKLNDLTMARASDLDAKILKSCKFNIVINNVVTVGTTEAWVTNYDKGKELKLVNPYTGDVVKSINTDLNISDIAVTPAGDIIATDYEGKSVSKVPQAGEVTQLINTHPMKPSGVCIGKNKKDIVVCLTNSDESKCYLVVYSDKGKEIKRISYTSKPVGEYVSQRVTQNDKGDYCVIHHGQDMVYVLDMDGLPKFTYTGTDITAVAGKFCPRYLCCDKYNNLLISDTRNKNVQMIDNEGKFIGTILTNHPVTMSPSGLSIDAEGKLWVGHFDGCLSRVEYLK